MLGVKEGQTGVGSAGYQICGSSTRCFKISYCGQFNWNKKAGYIYDRILSYNIISYTVLSIMQYILVLPFLNQINFELFKCLHILHCVVKVNNHFLKTFIGWIFSKPSDKYKG